MRRRGSFKKNGANRVAAYCTHPVLSGTAIDNIDKSTLDEVVVTDTIPLTKKGAGVKKDKAAQRS